MFGKVAADVLGISDVGRVIGPQDFDKVDADDYVMHEDGETIIFLIKSKSDEYCFTNKALIHVDGASAASSKRSILRYEYSMHMISNVWLETAGKLDMDVELKFNIGNRQMSIDVHKDHLEWLKDLYKSLIKISEIKRENELLLQQADKSLQIASTTLSRGRSGEARMVQDFQEINQTAFAWLTGALERYRIKDFGFVFAQYLNR